MKNSCSVAEDSSVLKRVKTYIVIYSEHSSIKFLNNSSIELDRTIHLVFGLRALQDKMKLCVDWHSLSLKAKNAPERRIPLPVNFFQQTNFLAMKSTFPNFAFHSHKNCQTQQQGSQYKAELWSNLHSKMTVHGCYWELCKCYSFLWRFVGINLVDLFLQVSTQQFAMYINFWISRLHAISEVYYHTA